MTPSQAIERFENMLHEGCQCYESGACICGYTQAVWALNALKDFIKDAQKDKARLDWLADVNNKIGNVQLPRECILDNLHDMRSAIDAAMEIEQ